MTTPWTLRTAPATSWFLRGTNIAPYETDDGYWVFLPQGGNGQFVDAGAYMTLIAGASNGERLTKVTAGQQSYVRFQE